jgi:hypothetical protein
MGNGRTKEFLDRSIQQGGGSKGHSSIEDSVASLDLVRWFVLNVLNKKTKPVIVTVGARAGGRSGGGGGGGGSGSGNGTALTTKM